MGCGKVFALKAISQLLRRWYSLSNRKCFSQIIRFRWRQVGRLERIITDLYTYPEMAKRIFFLAKQIRPLLPTMSDSLFAWRGGGGGGRWSLAFTLSTFLCSLHAAFINEVCTSNTLQKQKLNLKVFKSVGI